MKAPSLRTILEVLSRRRLLRLADELQIDVDRRAAVGELADDIAAAGGIEARELVELLTVSEWFQLCQACGAADAAERGRRRVPARAKLLQLDAGDDRVMVQIVGQQLVEQAELDELDAGAPQLVEPAQLDAGEQLEQQQLVDQRAAYERRRRRARARLYDEAEVARRERPPAPITRADCVNGPRPCPWMACRYHLATIRTPYKPKPPGEALPRPRRTNTCMLDVADRGGCTLAEVADDLGITRERVRQIEVRALSQPGVRSALEEWVAG